MINAEILKFVRVFLVTQVDFLICCVLMTIESVNSTVNLLTCHLHFEVYGESIEWSREKFHSEIDRFHISNVNNKHSWCLFYDYVFLLFVFFKSYSIRLFVNPQKYPLFDMIHDIFRNIFL